MTAFWDLVGIGFATGLGSALGTYIVNNHLGKKIEQYAKFLQLNLKEVYKNGTNNKTNNMA